MSDHLSYWKECLGITVDENQIPLTDAQLTALAEAAEGGHDNYSMAFYSPPASDRLNDIEREWKAKYDRLKSEFDAYKSNAETAVKQALRVHRDDSVSIEKHGEVYRHGGRTTQIQ